MLKSKKFWFVITSSIVLIFIILLGVYIFFIKGSNKPHSSFTIPKTFQNHQQVAKRQTQTTAEQLLRATQTQKVQHKEQKTTTTVNIQNQHKSYKPTNTYSKEDIKTELLRLIKNDPQFRKEVIATLLGLEKFKKDLIDIDKFELKKTQLLREIELMKLNLQKQKLVREYQKLLKPETFGKKEENQQILLLKQEIEKLNRQILALKQELKEAKSQQKKQENKNKTTIPAQQPISELIKNYLGLFTSVAIIGGKKYVFDKNGNHYTIGDFLPSGEEIVDISYKYVVIKTPDGIKLTVPVGKPTMVQNTQTTSGIPSPQLISP